MEVSAGVRRTGPFLCAATITVPTGCKGTLQILIHGATYNRWYWDPPVQLEKYSYVHFAAGRGYATVNIDLVGSGRSSHPDGSELGLALHAATVDRIATLARSGLAGHQWNTVVGVGHSLGTCVLMTTLGAYENLSAAVLTGISHEPAESTSAALQVAGQDPVFRERNVTDYLTMPAGSRPFYYHLPSADPAILLDDEQHRDVVGLADVEDYARVMREPCAAKVPLLIGLGAEDRAFTARDDAEFRAAESRWYPHATAIDFCVYPRIGHNINLHGAANRSMNDFLDWVEEIGR